MKYCTQCIDQESGKTGDFGYDPAKGSFHAITPIFGDLSSFFEWCYANGIVLDHSTSDGQMGTLELTRKHHCPMRSDVEEKHTQSVSPIRMAE